MSEKNLNRIRALRPLASRDYRLLFAAVGIEVFGTDYPTRDGSCIRDFIHVMDLAEAHVATLEWMVAQPADEVGVRVWNIGRGEGVTVFEMIQAFERVTGRPVPFQVVGRRPGDIAASCASVDAIAATVGWRASRDTDAMVRDLWAWQQANPSGYAGDAP
mgnify:CR=1 FL=1